MIKSLSFEQDEILNSILELNGLHAFDVDLTYGNGNFYKNVPEPYFKLDIDPQLPDITEACSTHTGLPGQSFNSVVFDPPFLTYIRNARSHDSIMAKRYGGYWRYDELEQHYRDTLEECARILKKNGIVVFKCQDIIHNHKMHCTHVNVIEWASEYFRLKDLFILGGKHRLPMPSKEGEKPRKQKHARIHHCYFLVLERIK